MIRSDAGVTACFALVAGTVYGRDPSRRVFTTFLECVLADRGVHTFFVITCPLRASSQALVNLVLLYSKRDRRVAILRFVPPVAKPGRRTTVQLHDQGQHPIVNVGPFLGEVDSTRADGESFQTDVDRHRRVNCRIEQNPFVLRP